MNDLISIIIPIYNVKKYLPTCLSSIACQTYANLEIILVDDGSNDGSEIICDEYAKKDKRFIAIHKENKGVSNSRNVGIDNASGKYIAFVDSDDYIDKDYIESMYNLIIKNDVDIVLSNFEFVYNDKRIKNELNIDKEIITKDEAMNYLMNKSQYLSFVVLWNKLYKRELLVNTRFKDGIIHEDADIAHRLIDSLNKIYVFDQVKYHYVQRSGSIMRTLNPTKGLVMIDIYRDRYNYLMDKKYDKELLDKAYYFYAMIHTNLAHDYYVIKDKQNYKRLIKMAKKIKKEIDFKKMNSKLKTKYKIKYFLTKFHLLSLFQNKM